MKYIFSSACSDFLFQKTRYFSFAITKKYAEKREHVLLRVMLINHDLSPTISTSCTNPITCAVAMVILSKQHKRVLYASACLAAYFALFEGRNRGRGTPIPYHNSHRSGNMLFMEILHTRNASIFHDMCRTSKTTFKELVKLLKERWGA